MLNEAIEEAGRLGDEQSELRAGIERAYVLHMRSAAGWIEEARRTAERAIAAFERLGDDGNLAAAWTLRGLVDGRTGNGEARIRRSAARASTRAQQETSVARPRSGSGSAER